MEKYNVTEEEVIEYVLIHRTEDFPMDKTLDDFYKQVREWCDLNAKYYKQN